MCLVYNSILLIKLVHNLDNLQSLFIIINYFSFCPHRSNRIFCCQCRVKCFKNSFSFNLRHLYLHDLNISVAFNTRVVITSVLFIAGKRETKLCTYTENIIQK